jgi:hypothetical protein
MSRTIRRNKFNKKKRFFHHYWESYSQIEVNEQSFIEVWKYHSDNYYTKSCKDLKQFFKNNEYRNLRYKFKKEIAKIVNLDDFLMDEVKVRSIKNCIH